MVLSYSNVICVTCFAGTVQLSTHEVSTAIDASLIAACSQNIFDFVSSTKPSMKPSNTDLRLASFSGVCKCEPQV